MIWKVNILEILFTLFALFAWSRAYLRFREQKISGRDLFMWTLVWGVLMVLVFIPGKADFFARKFGVTEGNDLIFFLAISILFYFVYRIYVKIGDMEKETTEIVRKIALDELRKKK